MGTMIPISGTETEIQAIKDVLEAIGEKNISAWVYNCAAKEAKEKLGLELPPKYDGRKARKGKKSV